MTSEGNVTCDKSRVILVSHLIDEAFCTGSFETVNEPVKRKKASQNIIIWKVVRKSLFKENEENKTNVRVQTKQLAWLFSSSTFE